MSRSAAKQLVASVLASNFVAPLTLPFARIAQDFEGALQRVQRRRATP